MINEIIELSRWSCRNSEYLHAVTRWMYPSLWDSFSLEVRPRSRNPYFDKLTSRSQYTVKCIWNSSKGPGPEHKSAQFLGLWEQICISRYPVISKGLKLNVAYAIAWHPKSCSCISVKHYYFHYAGFYGYLAFMELWKSQADEEENRDLQNMDLSFGMDKALQVTFPPRQKSKVISLLI